MDRLPELEHLEVLNLYATNISDSSVDKLISYKSLKALYLWQTDISEDGLASLRQGLPDTRIDFGSALEIVVKDSTVTE